MSARARVPEAGMTGEEDKKAAKSGRGWRLFARNRKGATAVEFAIVAIPFFWLMMGLAEVGMVFNTQSNLDFAMMEVSREIRTGQVQAAGMNRAQLRTELCNHMTGIMGSAADCELRLHLDVRAFPNFQTLAVPDVAADDDIQETELQFDPGEPSEVVIVRAMYEWHLVTPLMNRALVNFGNDRRLLLSTGLFVNEPFDDGT